jgi:hypothetical protein
MLVRTWTRRKAASMERPATIAEILGFTAGAYAHENPSLV